jgi:diguanylate cyclase
MRLARKWRGCASACGRCAEKSVSLIFRQTHLNFMLTSPSAAEPLVHSAVRPAAPSPARTWVQKLREAFYGSDALCREHISRLMRTVWLTVVAGILLGISTGLGMTPFWATALTVGYSSLIVGGLYTLMRSGVARRWSAPSMTQVQLMLAISAVVVSYGTADIARGAALQLLCLLLAFEMDRLNQRQLITTSLFALVMLCLVSTARALMLPGQVHLALEVYDLVMAAVLLPLAIVVGGEISRCHSRLLRQRELLGSTLTQLNALSTCDALTGVANRRHAMGLLDIEHKRLLRGGADFCVALLDIDWFKRINDSHGHGVGDRVLQRFARLCADTLPASDTVARWGGEEFLILMPACDSHRAASVLAQLRLAVLGEAWSDIAPGLRLSFSAGVAAHEAASPLAQTLERADRALYNAKDMGRDRTVTAALPLRAAVAPDLTVDAKGPPRSSLDSSPDPAPSPSREKAWAEFGPALAAAQPGTRSHDLASAVAIQAASPHMPAEGDIILFEPESAATPNATASPWRQRVHRVWQRLGHAVMGSDSIAREQMRLPLIAIPVHLFWVAAVVWYALPAQHIGAAQGWVVVAYELASVVVFYALIRSRVTAQWRDPALVLPQMLAALLVVAYGYAVAPMLRASLLHLMCVILVFGMVTLRTAASRTAGVFSVLLLVAVWFSIWWQQPDQAAAEALKLGLAGFVLARLAMLSQNYSQVRRHVAVEQKQLSLAVAQVQELVIRDALTGLFNRKHMQDLLHREHDRFGRTGQRYCVALIDIDHFKKVNDLHGHQTGDEVLCGLAKAAQACLRQTDVIARWGGEEFLVLMPDTDHASQGLAALARLRLALAQMPWHGGDAQATAQGDAPPLHVSFSAGLASVHEGESIDQLIERADRALYAAKDQGRNCDLLATANGGGIMATGPSAAPPSAPWPSTRKGSQHAVT